jgi:hypothetical protein
VLSVFFVGVFVVLTAPVRRVLRRGDGVRDRIRHRGATGYPSAARDSGAAWGAAAPRQTAARGRRPRPPAGANFGTVLRLVGTARADNPRLAVT